MLSRPRKSPSRFPVGREPGRNIRRKTLPRDKEEERCPRLWIHLGRESFTKTLHVGFDHEVEKVILLCEL
ncbi:hypothetical protein LIER_13651 [Lithospermum erythrorhizon]|uniref:Uncharacterized protein n=1 Tax=Lithospermum erythrorhizon TaxID=34254 RepID=A0AAV3PYG7_LITER